MTTFVLIGDPLEVRLPHPAYSVLNISGAIWVRNLLHKDLQKPHLLPRAHTHAKSICICYWQQIVLKTGVTIYKTKGMHLLPNHLLPSPSFGLFYASTMGDLAADGFGTIFVVSFAPVPRRSRSRLVRSKPLVTPTSRPR